MSTRGCDISRPSGARLVSSWLSALVALALLSPVALAQSADLKAQNTFLGISTFRLWEGAAPGALGASEADVPTLTIFRPHFGTNNGTAVVIAPGGAYVGLAANLEGRQVADWYTARGVTAFVLRYRLGKSYLYPTPLVDATRAIRYVRAHAADFGISPGRIGVMGFSAGGHLMAMASTTFDAGKPGDPDPVERVGSRPDYVVLGYPWLNAMKRNADGSLAYCGVMGIPPERCAQYEQYSPDLGVTAETPPTFIFHTTDDETVPVEASVVYYRALAAAKVPVEMHLFAHGRHGVGLGMGDAALDLWPTVLEAWMRERGLFTQDTEVAAATKRILAPPAPRRAGEPLTIDSSLGDLLADPKGRAVLVSHLGAGYVDRISEQEKGVSLHAMTIFDPEEVTPAKLAAIASDLGKL
jgi:acetyl esterase/lipase